METSESRETQHRYDILRSTEEKQNRAVLYVNDTDLDAIEKRMLRVTGCQKTHRRQLCR